MKKIALLTILLCLCGLLSKAQFEYSTDPVTKKFFYSKTYQTKLNKAKLYPKIKEWYASQLNEKRKEIQVDDKAVGSIIAKIEDDIDVPYGLSASNWPRYHVIFLVKVNYKDFKYRCAVTDIFLKGADDEDPVAYEYLVTRMADSEYQKGLVKPLKDRLGLEFYNLIYSTATVVDKKDDF
jgi:hypothetical protein